MAQSLDNLSRTWSDAGTTFTAIKYDITDTASNAASLLMDLRVGGASRFSVSKAGGAVAAGGTNTNVAYAVGQANTGIYSRAGGFFNVAANGSVRVDISNTEIFFGAGFALSDNTALSGNIVRLSVDAANTLAQRNGANAQTFRIYNTFTDASNHERGKIEWSSNVLRIGTEKAGSGTARALELQTDGVTRLTINTSGNTTLTGALTIGASSSFSHSGRVIFSSPAVGVYTLQNNTQTDWDRLQFGGTASSFPALKRDTVRLQARLADDSAFTNIQGKLTTETAYAATAPTPTGYLVLYDSTGTAYKVPAEAL